MSEVVLSKNQAACLKGRLDELFKQEEAGENFPIESVTISLGINGNCLSISPEFETYKFVDAGE